MRKVLLTLSVFMLLFLGACTTQIDDQNQEQNIDKVVLERYGMFTMPEFAIQNVTITSEGILYETFYFNSIKSGEMFTEFEGNEFEELVLALESNGFFELEERYVSNVSVADVGGGRVTVFMGEESKTVEIDPFISEGNPNEIAEIVLALHDILSKAEFPGP